MATVSVMPTSTKQYASNVTAIPKSAVAIMLRVGGFGNRKQLDLSDVSIDADKEWLGAKKKLLESPELSAVNSAKQRAEHFMLSFCVPSCFKAGVYLVPRSQLESVLDRLKVLRDEWQSAVDAFLDVYEERASQAKLYLRGKWDESDYVSLAAMRRKFYFEWNLLSMEVPGTIAEISADIFEEERRKAQEAWAEAIELGRDYIRAEVKELIEELLKRLGAYDRGEQKTIKESSLGMVREFIRAFEPRNEITNDTQLAAMVERMRKILNGVSLEDVRDSQSMRGYVMQSFGKMADQLETMMIAKPKRSVEWDD